MKKLAGLLFLLVILATGVYALNKASSPSMVESKPGTKEQWLSTMQSELPKVLCEPSHYFVKCFEVNETQCLEATNQYVQGCLNNVVLALPAELDKQQGEHWGQMVGRCSFDLYEKFMKSKKRNLPECELKDPATP